MALNIGTQIEIEIKRLGINGEGIAYDNKKAIFVDYALPGEIAKVEILEDLNTYYKAKLIEIITPSKDRVTPFCSVYFECGGCQLQHLSYQGQLNLKRELILQALKRYTKGKIKFGLVKETIGMENPYNYRNKASLPVMFQNEKTTIGMYKPNSNHLVDFTTCPVQDEELNKVYRLILNQMEKRKIEAINHGGVMRFIIVRRAHHTGEVQITFIVKEKDEKVRALGKYLVDKFDYIKSAYEVVNSNLKNREFFTNQIKLVGGEPNINETLGGINYKLAPNAFFQLNTPQAIKLYEKVVSIGEFKKTDVVVDAFGGVGPFAFYIAPQVKQVFSIELEKGSHESLVDTIKTNNINNISALLGDVKTVINKEKIQADVMLFDPPRVGLGKAFTDFLLKYRPKKLIYVSCNPSTLAKDLDELLQAYEVKNITPIDMFPHTSHVETITLLSLKTA